MTHFTTTFNYNGPCTVPSYTSYLTSRFHGCAMLHGSTVGDVSCPLVRMSASFSLQELILSDSLTEYLCELYLYISACHFIVQGRHHWFHISEFFTIEHYV